MLSETYLILRSAQEPAPGLNWGARLEGRTIVKQPRISMLSSQGQALDPRFRGDDGRGF